MLIPKISSSSSSLSSASSSMKDGACAFLALGFTFWNRSLVAWLSKIDTGALLSLLFFDPAGPRARDGSGAVLVTLGAGVALLLLTVATEPNRSSSSEERDRAWLSRLTSLESVSPRWVDPGSERTEGRVRDSVKDSWEGEGVGNALAPLGLGSVGRGALRLGFPVAGKPGADVVGLSPGCGSTVLSSGSETDRWADCCLAARDWGLRRPAPLARLCRRKWFNAFTLGRLRVSTLDK